MKIRSHEYQGKAIISIHPTEVAYKIDGLHLEVLDAGRH